MIGRHSLPKSAVPADAVGNRRWRTPIICLVLAAMTFAVFAQTLRYQFVNFDDNLYVYENPQVASGLSLKGLSWVFTHADGDLYHPLTFLSYMADDQLHGLRPGGYHLTNVLLHTASVILLFLVLRQMTGAFWRSAFVAAVFAIHPLRVESVAWVAGRKDVLSGLFFMLTLGAYLRYVRRPWSLARYGLVLLCFALGMMSKPMLVTLPLVLLLLDYWPLQRVESQKLSGLVVEKLPFLAVSAAGCVIALLARHGAIHSGGSFALPHRLGNALASGIIYLGQMVYPAGLTALYPFPHSGTPVWEEALAAMLLASLSVIAWRERRTRPWLLMGWVWYLVMLMPVVGLIQISGQAHADRYTYLPQIGIYIALAWWVAQWRVSRVVLGGLMASVLGVLMVCAWKQTAYWQNSETLWVHTLACTTDNAVAHDNYGTFLYQKGRVDEAIPQFQSALAIRPNFPEADNNLGFALLQQGQVDQAIAHYQKALQIKPDYVKAHNSLGIALCQKGRVDEGIVQFQEALKIDPALAEAHNNLGNAFLQEGRVDRAIACYEKALAISPGYAPGRSNLAKALLQKHRADETIIH